MQTAAITKPQQFTVYLDESGSTGDAALPSSVFGNQPAFALVGIAAPVGTAAVDDLLATLKRQARSQAPELKGKILANNSKLTNCLLDGLRDNQVVVFAELMDKRFYVATNILAHVLQLPHWAAPHDLTTFELHVLADFITEVIGDHVISAYCAFARTPTAEKFGLFANSFVHALRCASPRNTDEHGLPEFLALHLCSAMRAAHTSGETGCLEFAPPPDQFGRSGTAAMLPHIPAFANMYARINKFAGDEVTVCVVHDEQFQAASALEYCAQTLAENTFTDGLSRLPQSGIAKWQFSPQKISLQFGDSVHHAGIQVADLLAWLLTNRLNKVIANSSLTADRTVGSALFNFSDLATGVGVNVVATTQCYRRFWGEEVK